jgi:hypothetical protein
MNRFGDLSWESLQLLVCGTQLEGSAAVRRCCSTGRASRQGAASQIGHLNLEE